MGDEQPMLIVVANGAATDMLARFVEEHAGKITDEVAVLETTVPIRITAADAARYLYGNGDLIQIHLIEGDGIALPDPEQRLSPFDDHNFLDDN
jgi:hypothetical protein